MGISRRDTLLAGLAGGVTVSTLATVRAEAVGRRAPAAGSGRYVNPVVPGDQPDPSVVRDGDTYYKVSSSFNYYPGLVIWKSHDLVTWSPVVSALRTPVGSVFAPEIVKHDGRWFIYFPAFNLSEPGKPSDKPIMAIMVVHAASIAGPWSEPVDMRVYDGIDPGHVVGEDGKRYLFLDGGRLVPISDDGLSRAGKTEKVYQGWNYPSEWAVETFALESPKLIRRSGWFYMFSAEGGTAGPPTSHMVVVARSRSVRGPWENCPHNPLVHTASAAEPWWSRGHATAVEGPAGDWWLVYHGYRNGFRTLGRQMLLEPFVWDADGWPRATGGDLSRPLPAPRGGRALPLPMATLAHGVDGTSLQMFKPQGDYSARVRSTGGDIVVAGQGAGAGTSSPLVINTGDASYEMEVEVEVEDGAEAGIMLFYDERYNCALGTDGTRLRTLKHGVEPYGLKRQESGARIALRLVNRENVVTFFYRGGTGDWTTWASFEVSGYNHNIADGFLSLRPALYCARQGGATFRKFRYAALA